MNKLNFKLNLKQIIFITISLVAFVLIISNIVYDAKNYCALVEMYKDTNNPPYININDLTNALTSYSIFNILQVIYFLCFIILGIKLYFINKENILTKNTILIRAIVLIILSIIAIISTIIYIFPIFNAISNMTYYEGWSIMLLTPITRLVICTILLLTIIHSLIKLSYKFIELRNHPL